MNVEERDPEEIGIEPQRPRRWVGWMSWGILMLIVAGLLAWVLARFTSSVFVAVGLVVFMVGYMAVMAYWASKEGR